MNIALATDLANCASKPELLNLMAGNNIYIVNTKAMNKIQSNIKFAYHDGENKAFTVLVNNECL